MFFFSIGVHIDVQNISLWNSFKLSHLLLHKLQKYLPIPCKSVRLYGSLHSVKCVSVKAPTHSPKSATHCQNFCGNLHNGGGA